MSGQLWWPDSDRESHRSVDKSGCYHGGAGSNHPGRPCTGPSLWAGQLGGGGQQDDALHARPGVRNAPSNDEGV